MRSLSMETLNTVTHSREYPDMESLLALNPQMFIEHLLRDVTVSNDNMTLTLRSSKKGRH